MYFDYLTAIKNLLTLKKLLTIYHPQKVQYNSPNKMYISHKFSGSDTPSPSLLVFSIHERNKSLVNKLCTSLIKFKFKKFIIFFISIYINVFYCQYLRHFTVVCVHNESNTNCHLQKKISCQSGKISTKLYAEFK